MKSGTFVIDASPTLEATARDPATLPEIRRPDACTHKHTHTHCTYIVSE